MNRRGFFKSIGAVSAATLVAPHILLEESPTMVQTVETNLGNGIWHQLKRGRVISYEALTRDKLREAIEQVFNENQIKENLQERRFVFHCSDEQQKEINRLMLKSII